MRKRARRRHAEDVDDDDDGDRAADAGSAARSREQVVRGALPLYCLIETLVCAARGCVSCAHKIVAGELIEPGLLPNVRPEMCPRISGEVSVSHEKGIGLYLPEFRILTVGDGDLSFSLSLARALGGEVVTATTWESRSDVEAIYQSLPKIQELENDLGAVVKHHVDAASLTEFFDPNSVSFDYIVFNFPCVAPPDATPGLDGQMQHFEENRRLLNRFGSCASRLLASGGQLHVSHKTKASFGNWNIPELIQAESTLVCMGAVVFDRAAYPGYVNKKQRDNRSFPVTDAVTYVFGFKGEEESAGMESSVGGADKQQQGEEFSTLADLIRTAKLSGQRITKVTYNMIELIKKQVLQPNMPKCGTVKIHL